jgi:hypothetical protein
MSGGDMLGRWFRGGGCRLGWKGGRNVVCFLL